MNNREFKFRVWDKSSKQWENSTVLEVIHGDGILRSILDFDLENSVVQQYTGLLDKNGKEIYEGDIIRTGYENQYGSFYYNYLVVYNSKTCVFEGLMSEDQKSIGIRITHNVVDNIEILGNIFENSELLKQ